jgi:virginiamycin B lyase
MNHKYALSAAVLTAAVLVAACSGGGGGNSPAPAVAQPTVAPQPNSTGIAGPANGTHGAVTLTIPAATGGSALTRRPQFVSPSAASATVTINGSGANYDVSGTSPNCTPVTGGRNCTLPVSVAGGTTSATVTLSIFDGLAGSGTLLGSGSGSATIAANATTFNVPVDISPVIASATINSLTFPNGLPRIVFAQAETGSASITFKDPDHNVVPATSTSTFVTPITLTASDPHVTVGPPITNAAQTIAVTYDGSALIAASVTFTVKSGATTLATSVAKTSGFTTVFSLAATKPYGIAVGSDNNLWITEEQGENIVEMSTAGSVLGTFPIPSTTPGPTYIAPGPPGDTHVWYSQPGGGNNYGEIGSSAVATGAETDVFTGLISSAPAGVVAAGGNIWFALTASNQMFAVSPAAVPVPSPGPQNPPAGTGPAGVALGPDGNVWVTGSLNGTILAYSAASPFGISAGPFSVPAGAASTPLGIVAGPDGALWFTEQTASNIGRITLTGTMNEFATPVSGSLPTAITTNPDGGIWFSEGPARARIARLDPTTHAFIEYPQAANTEPFAIVTGPDGNLWYADWQNSTIVRFQP